LHRFLSENIYVFVRDTSLPENKGAAMSGKCGMAWDHLSQEKKDLCVANSNNGQNNHSQEIIPKALLVLC
jgi:hypothetical protein